MLVGGNGVDVGALSCGRAGVAAAGEVVSGCVRGRALRRRPETARRPVLQAIEARLRGRFVVFLVTDLCSLPVVGSSFEQHIPDADTRVVYYVYRRRLMTMIRTIEDLVQLLDDNPRWLDAVRARVLTRELIELPHTLARLAGSTGERFDEMDRQFEKIDRRFELVDQRLDRVENGIGRSGTTSRR